MRAKEGDPFAAYAKELLKLADYLQNIIKSRLPDGKEGPWLGEDGYWYRKAEAEGEKYAADCEVIYGDVVMLPAETGYAWKAVYKKMPEITMDQTGSSEEEQKEMMEESFWKELIRQILKDHHLFYSRYCFFSCYFYY
ncbi:MAG: hypothetical protein V8S98_09745 [Lachnospiraceae bacterium]